MMATYFHGGSEIQASDNLQTLYLMNPNYLAAYTSEAHNNHPSQTPPNMLLLNSSAGPGPNGLSQESLPTPTPQPGHQQFIGIPLAGGPHSENPGRPSPSSSLHHHHQIPGSLHGVAVSRLHYNLWSPTVDPSPSQIPTAMVAGPDAEAGPMGFRRPATAAQGLSLSLSPQQQNNNPGAVGGGDDRRMSVTLAGGSSAASVSNGVQGVILGSKYLKAAQELLDEVVNVGTYSSKGVNNGDNGESSGAHKDKAKAAAKEPVTGEGWSGGTTGESSGGSKKAAEQLTTAQRQDLQMKKAKLLNMLDEVDQRYRQYYTQMQLVVSSFEQAAGIGSVKSYTSLALQTISRQFRCLKDAIVSQIKATSKSLGEDDTNGSGSKLEGGGVGSRLRFVDHQLRQQRALQQLGMMQHNAWRPQRGLPERAVSVLRAWLFEHFLHPYPKDSDKHMLAKQTGLTRSQVSNWFINARVRLWKPMVEEMYMEEMKAQEQNGGSSENNTNNNGTSARNDPNKDQSTSEATGAPGQQQQQHEQQQHIANGGGGSSAVGLIQAHQQGDRHHQTNDMISNLSTMSTTSMSSQGFTLIGASSDMESLMARSPKKQRSMQSSPSSILSMDMEMKPPGHQQSRNQLSKFGPQDPRQSPMIIGNHHQGATTSAGFNPYIVNDMGRFNPDQLITTHQYHGNNGVSLTLGLPHCDPNHQSLSLSGSHQQSFIPDQGMQPGRRLDIGSEDQDEFCGISMGMGQPSHPNNGYESIDIQSRKRFAAHQLLHDFVA